MNNITPQDIVQVTVFTTPDGSEFPTMAEAATHLAHKKMLERARAWLESQGVSTRRMTEYMGIIDSWERARGEEVNKDPGAVDKDPGLQVPENGNDAAPPAGTKLR